VIAEPIAANMGFVLPEPGYLAGLHQLCRSKGALFILDEVMTGFRVAPGGAQELWGLDPDITCLGKVIGGGLPLAAYGGKRAIMGMMAPAGPVYQAGTLSGNPLATTAGLATIRQLLEPGVFAGIAESTALLAADISEQAVAHGIPMQVSHAGTMLGFYFLKQPYARIKVYAEAKSLADTKRYARFFHLMLEQGVYFAPSQFEAAFLSSAHGRDQLEQALAAFERTMTLL
jgi:glutamate-1-semialdehyde 2,1-aminomutase